MQNFRLSAGGFPRGKAAEPVKAESSAVLQRRGGEYKRKDYLLPFTTMKAKYWEKFGRNA